MLTQPKLGHEPPAAGGSPPAPRTVFLRNRPSSCRTALVCVLVLFDELQMQTTHTSAPCPRLELSSVLVTRASTRQHKKILISGTIGAFRSGRRVANVALLSPGTVMKSSGERHLQRTQCPVTPCSFLYTGFIPPPPQTCPPSPHLPSYEVTPRDHGTRRACHSLAYRMPLHRRRPSTTTIRSAHDAGHCRTEAPKPHLGRPAVSKYGGPVRPLLY